MQETDKNIMAELIVEHAMARRTVNALENAKKEYVSGKTDVRNEVLDLLNALTILYPTHIEKEDKHFFYPSMEYFSGIEQNEMMLNFVAFNQEFTDKMYKQIIRAIK